MKVEMLVGCRVYRPALYEGVDCHHMLVHMVGQGLLVVESIHNSAPTPCQVALNKVLR